MSMLATLPLWWDHVQIIPDRWEALLFFFFFFLTSFCGEGYFFFIFLFVCFVRFLQCCISQSMLGAEWSFHVMFCGQFFFTVRRKVGGPGGQGVCMALSLSVSCTFLSFDISIAKPIVFFELHFDFDIPNISYIITVFSFQCNAFLRHSHPPTWRRAQVKIGHNKR